MEQSASAEIQEEANALIINVNENSETQRETNSPRGNESQNGGVDREANLLGDRRLTDEIKEMLGSVEPPLSPKCCIYRIPHDLRKLNEEAYTPKVISIGPFHRDNKRLKAMEKFKMRYFKRFVQQAKLDEENLVSIIRGMEGAVRQCYAETSKLSSDNYVKMIMVDASFIIAFFLDSVSEHVKWSLDNSSTAQHVKWSIDDSSTALLHSVSQHVKRSMDDSFKNLLQSVSQHVNWSIDDSSTAFTQRLMCNAQDDMWLLENQLPFFVMEKLYNLAFPTCSNVYSASFKLLTFIIFNIFDSQGIILHVPPDDPKWNILHFCDLLRTFFLPPSNELPKRCCGCQFEHLQTASQLDEAGVKFKEGSSQRLFDLNFTKGVLEIPRLNLWATTESLFRNLVALEQCHYLDNAYVTDYILVLDSLIDTSKDVDLLVEKGILNNTLGDSKAVTTMVNKIGQHIRISSTNSNYYILYADLNIFYERPWHRWKATLRRDYLSTPWRTASTVAAIILLVLTLTQTICSIISLP